MCLLRETSHCGLASYSPFARGMRWALLGSLDICVDSPSTSYRNPHGKRTPVPYTRLHNAVSHSSSVISPRHVST